MGQFTLHIPKDVEAQLRQCHASLRQSIRKRLQEIVDGLAARPTAADKAAVRTGPPLRFYVFEGCRISYQVNPLTRKVVVLKLRTEHG